MKTKKNDWSRGYFCAVAVLLRETCAPGVSNTATTSLFWQGGDWRHADPEDIQTFLKHGLLHRTAETDKLIRK